MADAPFTDLQRAHRWFAVEMNNLAWDLIEAAGRSPAGTPPPADAERMIHAAHAACIHWQSAGGTPLNELRAQCLLATAYARAGLAESAVRHAERCLALTRELDGRGGGDGGPTPFDRATAHGCAAAAYHLSGRSDEAAAQSRLARGAAAGLADADDRQVFERLYGGGN